MPDDNREEEFNRSYQLIGMFAVAFQKIIFQLQFTIQWIFNSQGLRNSHLISIFFADRTAMNIHDLARGLFNQVYQPQEEERKITESVFKEVRELIECRNNLLHGNMLVGYTHEGQTDFSEFIHIRIKKKRNGVELNSDKKKNEELESIVEKANRVNGQIFNMSNYFLLKNVHPIPIELNEYINYPYSG